MDEILPKIARTIHSYPVKNEALQPVYQMLLTIQRQAGIARRAGSLRKHAFQKEIADVVSEKKNKNANDSRAQSQDSAYKNDREGILIAYKAAEMLCVNAVKDLFS